MLQSVVNLLESYFGLSLIVGFVTLLGGGELLVRGSIAIARRLGLSPLLVGLTIVAFGTSAPELAFNLIAALDGASELSFGNIVGSNIANIGLVLGLAALVATLTVNERIMRWEFPFVILASGGMVALAWFDFGGKGAPGEVQSLSRIDGAIMLAGFGMFLLMMARMAQSDREIARRLEHEAGADAEEPPQPVLLGMILFLVGLSLLLAGGKMAEIGAVGVARHFEVSEVVIALVIVAIATSLPEVATSIMAAHRGHADLAIGNVVGSNIFNILLVMGTTSLIRPVDIPGGGFLDLTVMLAMTVGLLVVLVSTRRKIPLSVGLLLLAVYISYLVYRVAFHE